MAGVPSNRKLGGTAEEEGLPGPLKTTRVYSTLRTEVDFSSMRGFFFSLYSDGLRKSLRSMVGLYSLTLTYCDKGGLSKKTEFS